MAEPPAADLPTMPSRGAPASAERARDPDRYVVGERLGEGGMGVVFAAHDRVLDRPVAIKFLRDGLLGGGFQARLTDEARAMAKLSHPNVVAVYDVGDDGGRTYLVMELVRGVTVARWLATPRTWQEIVALFRGAGRGLAAAHAAGIVHRDVKPGNILVGDDGHPRVADFGIAAIGASAAAGDPQATTADELTGTKPYIAPERRRGTSADARGDQFAFAVALYEALHGRLPPDGDERATDERAIPAWLRDVVARGRAADPAARFPSMDAMVAALGGPSRRGWWIAGAIVVAAGGVTAAIAVAGSRAPDRCTGGGETIAAVWHDGVRDRLARHLRGLGGFGALAADRATTTLSRRAREWAKSSDDACRAHTRGALTAAPYDQWLSCLAVARSELAASVAVLEGATAAGLAPALIAASGAVGVADCVAATAGHPPPPPADAARARDLAADIERVRVEALASRAGAIAAATVVVARADALAYPPLVARARLVHGIALMTEQPEQAIHAVEPLGHATRTAFAIGDDALAVEAYARAIYALGTDPGQAGAPAGAGDLGGIAVMEPIAARLRGPGAFARALFFNNAGVVALASGDRATAQRWLDRALAEVRGGARPGDVELANVAANLALVVDDPRVQRELIDESISGLRQTLVAEHPAALDLVLRAAILDDDPVRVAAALAEPCGRYAELHAHQTLQVEECMFELGYLALVRGDDPAARDAFERVRGDTPPGAIAAAARRMLGGDAAGAADALDRLGSELGGDPAWWVRLRAADAMVAAAFAWRRAGETPRSVASASAAVVLLEPIARDVPQPNHRYRLAAARAAVTAGSR